MPEKAPGLAPDTEVAAAVSDAEADVASDVMAAASEDVSTVTLDETPSAPVKTPLPDNMLGGEAVGQETYSIGGVHISAVEASTALVADYMMSLAAGPTPDAITPQISLGASLIANGIVAKPEAPRSDPLAGIRRMSHAERIAFFS
jgi:hypothetical protein